MVIRRRLRLRLLLLAATAGAITIVPTVLSTDTSKPAVQIVGAPPCVNGVVPVNPYIVNCNLPPRRGSVAKLPMREQSLPAEAIPDVSAIT